MNITDLIVHLQALALKHGNRVFVEDKNGNLIEPDQISYSVSADVIVIDAP